MSLFGKILKNYVGLGEGIKGCFRDAESGDAKAQYALGCFYERAQGGLEQDYFQAAKWYRKAAEQGHAGAQLYLGILLVRGNGVEQDVVEAYKWIELAKRGNFLDRAAAVDTQNRLVEFMAAEQIAEGQRLSREFVPTKNNR